MVGTAEIRRLPVRIAGLAGVVAAFLYLAGILGQDDTEALPQAMFWFAVMMGAGLLAWFADRLADRARLSAVLAGGLFFVIAVFSNLVFATVFLVATALCVVGVVGVGAGGGEASSE